MKARCSICKKVYVADSTRHNMDFCPCELSWMDLEEDYVRSNTFTIEFEEFEPPWFDDEDDYHSALMSWLNDSDETFWMFKEDGILNVVKNVT